jgi:hypothetical protein
MPIPGNTSSTVAMTVDVVSFESMEPSQVERPPGVNTRFAIDQFTGVNPGVPQTAHGRRGGRNSQSLS